MGANATTFVPSYTSGEVLTAANLSVTNSGIPVFADSTARTAGFGGTGEKVLAEGQYAYLESDNSTSFYDGAAWQTIGGGMTLLSTTTLSGASTAITGISQDYNDLYIYCTKWYASSAANLSMYVNGNSTSGNYVAGYLRQRVGASTTLDNATYQVTAWAEGPGQHDNFQTIVLPNYTNSAIKFWTAQGFLSTDNGQNGFYMGGGAYFNGTSAITSLTFAPTAGTFSAGTVKIYGVK